MSLKVLRFYNNIPFNQYKSIRKECKSIKYNSPANMMPILESLDYNNEILEIGSGSGWLINGLAYHNNAFGIGLDFNKNAIEVAEKVSNRLKTDTRFIQKDLFDFAKTSEKKFKTIISFGVLHHTNDCHEAIKLIIENLLKENGTIILGLYHSYERQPFLDYFYFLKQNGLSDKKLFVEFKKLKHKNFINKNKHLIKSIFNDQVLHPHETQHSFVEIKNLLNKLDCKIIKTSINNYDSINNKEDWNFIENKILKNAKKDIKNGIFNPGLFVIKAIKN